MNILVVELGGNEDPNGFANGAVLLFHGYVKQATFFLGAIQLLLHGASQFVGVALEAGSTIPIFSDVESWRGRVGIPPVVEKDPATSYHDRQNDESDEELASLEAGFRASCHSVFSLMLGFSSYNANLSLILRVLARLIGIAGQWPSEYNVVMPNLVFDFEGVQDTCGMNKIDRSKLYGFVDSEVLDEEGRPCELATLAGDGKTLIPMGGTAFAYLSPDGYWRNKGDLKPVDVDGNPIEPVASSFKAPIALDTKVSVEEYLSHNIRITYVLTAEDGLGELEKALDDGGIYAFDFSYRGGLTADRAFLLKGDDGTVWMAVGAPTKIRFIGLQQAAVAGTEEEAVIEEDGDLDFGMM